MDITNSKTKAAILIVVLIVVGSTTYYVGQLVGFNDGVKSASNNIGSAGHPYVLVQATSFVNLAPGQSIMIVPEPLPASLNSSTLYYSLVSNHGTSPAGEFDLNLSFGSWTAYSSGYVTALAGNQTFRNLTANEHPFTISIDAKQSNNRTISLQFTSPLYLVSASA